MFPFKSKKDLEDFSKKIGKQIVCYVIKMNSNV